MSYKANGQSTGVVTVEFQRTEDANRAYAQYNNRLIDSKRPLKIEVVVDPARAPLGRAPLAPNKAARGKAQQPKQNKPKQAKPARDQRTAKSIEDLDAEMEDYTKQAADTEPSMDAAPTA